MTLPRHERDMIDTAVILAAGLGSRLPADLSSRPKGFLRLGEKPIVEESIARLRQAGVDNIVIVTGYCSGLYEALASLYPGCVRTVHNEKFADSGSMYSLYQARHELAGPFLLLESDLIYEPRALQALLEGPPNCVLLSGPTDSGDEVYVETRDGRLVNMSKDPRELGSEPSGELVGLCKLTRGVFDSMIDFSEDAFRSTLQVDYETEALVAASHKHQIDCPVIHDLLWAEIDDSDHLARATTIYPRLPPA